MPSGHLAKFMSKTHLGRSGLLTAARSQGDSGVPRHDARVRTANNLLLLCHFITDASETLKTFSFFLSERRSKFRETHPPSYSSDWKGGREGRRREGHERSEVHRNWVAVMSKFPVSPPRCPSSARITLANSYTVGDPSYFPPPPSLNTEVLSQGSELARRGLCIPSPILILFDLILRQGGLLKLPRPNL